MERDFSLYAGQNLNSGCQAHKPEEADVTIDLKKKPATIDIRPIKSPKTKLLLGIIEIKGDHMKLCFTQAGDRPTEFKVDGKNRAVLIQLKRVKTEK